MASGLPLASAEGGGSRRGGGGDPPQSGSLGEVQRNTMQLYMDDTMSKEEKKLAKL